MFTVRAKMKVEHVTNTVNGASVLLTPVTSGSKENENFYKYTPSGKVELSTINKAAAAAFIPGEEYYVDFTPAKVAGPSNVDAPAEPTA